MIQSIPANLLPWIIGSFVIGLFGIRSIINYRRLKAPLSKYFAISACLISVAMGLWGWSILFIEEGLVLRSLLVIGDFLLYSFLVFQSRIIWYLALSKINYLYLLIPAFLIALPGFITVAISDFTAPVGIIDGVGVYPTSPVGNIAQAILLMQTVTIGLLLFWKVKDQTTAAAKLNLASVGALFIFSGLGGTANVLLSSENGTNQAPIVRIMYFGGFIFFVCIFLFFKLSLRKKRS